MGPSFTSVVLVDHNFKALTDRFLIETTPDDLIFHLKVKVKEERPDELSPYRRSDVRVWKTKGTKAINLSSEESMPEILSTIDINDKNTIQKLSEEVKLAELGLSNFQSLLVQLPAGVKHDSLVGDPIIRDVDPGYVLSPLMKGWKYCPACKIPIQKVSGINHMSCIECNTHFCYSCGGLIVESTLGQEIQEAISSHYSGTCSLFEVPE